MEGGDTRAGEARAGTGRRGPAAEGRPPAKEPGTEGPETGPSPADGPLEQPGPADPPPGGTTAASAGRRPRPFRPAWWLPGPHGQTLVGRLLRAGTTPRYRRERWETPDGDFLDLDVWERRAAATAPASAGASRGDRDREPAGGRPLVLILHGLEGCSTSGYVLETCRRLAERGLRPVALNFRSRSGEPNRARRFYHSGETGDLAWVLDRLARREPGTPIGVVGYSLGGNVLLKYLGERGGEARGRVRAAVAVSVPYRLSESADALEAGLGPLYARFFLRSLRRSVRAKSARHGHEYDLPARSRARTLRAFDDAFTAPVHGFDGAEDYYRRSSSARYLPRVRVPTLLLQARDDPFLPADALPEEEMRANPWLAPHLTDRGGHLGFVAGATPWGARFWAEEEAARFMDDTLARPGT